VKSEAKVLEFKYFSVPRHIYQQQERIQGELINMKLEALTTFGTWIG
jgi:hypothetical protein